MASRSDVLGGTDDMRKLDTLQKIRSGGIVVTLQGHDPDVAFKTALACIEGGITCLEIAMTTPCALDLIESLGHEEGVTIGAGTVLDTPSATACIRMGARFLVSPTVIPDVIHAGTQAGVVSVPGATTPTEILMALRSGADIVKIFPACALGPRYIESLSAPFPQAVFMPSGSMPLNDLSTWFIDGVTAVGIDTPITAGATSRNYAMVKARARAFATASQAVKRTGDLIRLRG